MLAPAAAWAHGDAHPTTSPNPDRGWELATGFVLALAAALYLRGLARMRRDGAALAPARAVAYLAGLGAVALALLSSLDERSDVLFSAHMVQHELLMLAAAPLTVLGRPEVVVRRGLPSGVGEALGAALRRPRIAWAARVLANPWLAVALHGALLWVWHVPTLFEAALRSEAVHAWQHLGFFATAALFWWSMARGRYGRLGYGLAVVFVFVTALHTGLLGALLTVSGRTIYPTHAARSRAIGADALDDQRLAGLLMWIPAGAVTTALALALFVAWMGAIERRSARRARAAEVTA